MQYLSIPSGNWEGHDAQQPPSNERSYHSMCIKRPTKTMKSLKSRLPNSWATFSMAYYPPKSIMCILNQEFIIHLLITPTLCMMLPNREARNNIHVLFEFLFQSSMLLVHTRQQCYTGFHKCNTTDTQLGRPPLHSIHNATCHTFITSLIK